MRKNASSQQWREAVADDPASLLKHFPELFEVSFFFFKKFVALLSLPRSRKPPLISPGGAGGETQGEERWQGRCKRCGGGCGGVEEPEALESKTSAASLTKNEKKSRHSSSLRPSQGGARHKT